MALEKCEKKYFGTNGIRGVTGVDMTPAFALKIAEAFGTMLGEGKKVGIGRDTRTSGPALASAVRAGLMACGCDVVDFDIIPTPGLQYLVLHHGLDGGVMITASHNPRQYNGAKFIHAGAAPFNADDLAFMLEFMQSHLALPEAMDSSQEPQPG